MTAPARNYAQPVLAWYRAPNEVDAEAAGSTRPGDSTNRDGSSANQEDFGTLWALEAKKLRKRLRSATVHSNLQSNAAFSRYNSLDQDRKDDVAYKNLNAVEQIRLQMYQGPESNAVAQNLPPLTENETDNLLEVLESCIGKLTKGTHQRNLQGQLNDPEFFETLISAIDYANNAEVDNFNEENNEPEAHNNASELSAGLKAAIKARKHSKQLAGLRPQQVTDLLNATPKACKFIKEQKEQHQKDFIVTLDCLFSGNNSGKMSIDWAGKITGFN
ncbi:hypothetical protein F4679DRAFT_597854 [Xylaria curta]|nr:hypothetical protein F4679DRAFT_597854 [Xylaria curta]